MVLVFGIAVIRAVAVKLELLDTGMSVRKGPCSPTR